jgi:hypothetical protein
MNIKKCFKWSLILMAFIAYKQIEGSGGTDPSESRAAYISYQNQG